MKERSIIFNAHDVRAILDGRKTQTRRILHTTAADNPGGRWDFIGDSDKKSERNKWCYSWLDQWGNRISPKGEKPDCMVTPPCLPGDRLWVRESWAVPHTCDHLPPRLVPETARIHYLATAPLGGLIKRPSIHMPRWASRITLEVVGVRVERLQDISDEDVLSEGLKTLSKDGGRTFKTGLPARDGLPDGDGWPWRAWEEDPRRAYKRLWESIYGPDSWAQNPWGWVIEFRRVEP